MAPFVAGEELARVAGHPRLGLIPAHGHDRPGPLSDHALADGAAEPDRGVDVS